MQSLRGILNFARVAELGSFAKAGRELGISAAAVSQNISRLEASLGVRLLARSTRQLQLTPDGTAFLAKCSEPLAELELACREASSSAQNPSGRVRATVASPVAYQYLVPLLPQFFARYPDISLELELSEDANPLIDRRFDVGIRAGALIDAAFVARPLGPLRLLICGSPSYLARQPVPTQLAQLHEHAALQVQVKGQPSPFLVRLDTSRSVVQVPVQGRFICNDFRPLLHACIAGLGLAQLPLPVALAALRGGQLQHVLPNHVIEGMQLFIHYPSRKQLPARVKAFVDFCIEHLSGHADLSADVSAFAAPTVMSENGDNAGAQCL
jgi:DNA-binding transcriptional LysR family regulator